MDIENIEPPNHIKPKVLNSNVEPAVVPEICSYSNRWYKLKYSSRVIANLVNPSLC